MFKARQGDVYIFQTEKPKGEFQEVKQSKVLAEGEITGHKHLLVPKDESTISELYVEGKLYVDIKGLGATITHEEHKQVELMPGTYEVFIQREYSPLGERRVLD